jgi:hypothetical protein
MIQNQRFRFFGGYRGKALMVHLCLFLLVAGSAGAGTLELETHLNARSFQRLIEVEGRLFGGLDGGGLVYWDLDDLDSPQRVLADGAFAGNYITDMAWSGRNLWVATEDGGLARISDPGGDMEFRPFSSSIGGTDLTEVTAALINDAEVVYYAMDGEGIGRIIDGLPGNIYTADQDGLCSDDVTALQLYDGLLYVGTDSGVCRFANNVFEDVSDGLFSTTVNDMTIDADGNLLLSASREVYQWVPETQSWAFRGDTGSTVLDLEAGDLGIYTVGKTPANAYRMTVYQGDSSWSELELPHPRAFSVSVGSQLFLGGTVVRDGMVSTVGHAYLGQYMAGSGFITRVMDASLIANATGITFGEDGTPWIGSHNADGFSQLTADGWYSVYELASADNDSSGLFDYGANIVAMATGIDGIIYATQLSRGVIRHDPDTRVNELMFADNCGLEGGGVTNIMVHPDGPVFFMHDWRDANKVEVLVNPAAWRNPESWIVLPMGVGGLGTTSEVYAALVERNDVIWFAVADVGLVRWDINGDDAGPDDFLTWQDTSDDRWDEPVANLPGVINDPEQARALALAPDGSIWVGGNGLARFHYQTASEDLLLIVDEGFNEKTSPFVEGLIDGNVVGVTVDGAGAVWVATRSGVNRGSTRNGVTTFEAFFDPGNFLANSSFATLYSYDAVLALPGGEYRRMVVSPDGETILISSDRGAAEMQYEAGAAPGIGEGLEAFFYPSPFKPAEGEGYLKLGGIEADADAGDPAQVRIYNLEGQLVFEDLEVSTGEGFWDGRNVALERNDVVTGVYVIQITYRDKTVIKGLSVLR